MLRCGVGSVMKLTGWGGVGWKGYKIWVLNIKIIIIIILLLKLYYFSQLYKKIITRCSLYKNLDGMIIMLVPREKKQKGWSNYSVKFFTAHSTPVSPTPPLHNPPHPHPYINWHHSVSGSGRSNIYYFPHLSHYDPPHPTTARPTPPLHDTPPHPWNSFGNKWDGFHGVLHYVSLLVDKKG